MRTGWRSGLDTLPGGMSFGLLLYVTAHYMTRTDVTGWEASLEFLTPRVLTVLAFYIVASLVLVSIERYVERRAERKKAEREFTQFLGRPPRPGETWDAVLGLYREMHGSDPNDEVSMLQLYRWIESPEGRAAIDGKTPQEAAAAREALERKFEKAAENIEASVAEAYRNLEKARLIAEGCKRAAEREAAGDSEAT